MENKIESLELEEMRQQMNALKEQLDEQVKVNDENITKLLKENTRSFNNKGLKTLLVSLVCAFPMYIYCSRWGIPMICFWIVVAVMLADGCCSYYVTHMVKAKDLQKCDFSELIDKLVKMKKGIRILTIADYVLLIGILLFLFCQTFPLFSEHSTLDQIKVMVVFTIGAVCGIYFGGKEMKKRICQINEMISSLDRK